MERTTPLKTCYLAFYLLLILVGCSPSQEHITEHLVNFEEMQWYALRAQAAYGKEADIRHTLPNVSRVTTLEQIDVLYFIERLPESGAQLVSIRGTDNIPNIKQDAEYLRSLNSKLDIPVHTGFDADTMKLYKDMLPHLDKSRKVLLTGHSLGAAISTLLMMYLHEDGFDVGTSYNFGQPKVTNTEGVKKYAFLPLIRVINENDLVPLLPPMTIGDSIHGPYEHLGEEIILLQDQYYVFLDQHRARKNSVGSFWKNLEHESINNHRIHHYIAHIAPKLESSKQVPWSTREKYIRR